MSRLALFAVVVLLLASVAVQGADPVPIPANKQYLEFIRKEAARLRANDNPPATVEEWNAQETELRKRLLEAWGGFPETPCPLDPQTHGEPLKREGYTVEKITFQTRPGVRMTANLYIPDAAKSKKLPAILMVHGHWKGAKQDPVVQSRCIGAAKLGFVVLCVDAFGAGERGVGTALGEYHGEMTAATLLPLGTPLSGMQVYENMRAVDYLLTRPEVDGDKLGITGASGGGNQTMYAGAWDKRFKCVVPVCSVGNYQAYLGQACCMCEVVPGALQFTEEWAVLGLVAPRALMVINATQDAIQFSVGEAKKSLKLTTSVFKLLGKENNLQHAIFESPHDYSKAMRETMYGYMTLHLKGEGDGSPIKEPEFKTENPEDLRCFPGDTRPKDFMTIPRYAATQAKQLLGAKPLPKTLEELSDQDGEARTVLLERRWLPFGDVAHLKPVVKNAIIDGRSDFVISYGSGMEIPVFVETGKQKYTVVLLHLEGADAARKSELYAALKRTGVTIVTLDLRATGKSALASERVGRALDHHSAEWGLWLGTPLFAQWLQDVQNVVNVFQTKARDEGGEITVIGEGPAGLVALGIGARQAILVGRVAAVNTLASFVTDEPYTNQRLGTIVPGMLRDVGDVGHLAARCTGKRVVIGGGVSAGDKSLTVDQLKAAYEPAANAFKLHEKNKDFIITEPANVLKELGIFAAEEKNDEAIFETGAKLTKLSENGAGGEGPAWDPLLGVLTSGSKGIHQLTPGGKQLIFREKAGTNGLLFDRQGRLNCCEPDLRRMTRIDRDGKLTVLTDNFEGKKYNQPNDLTFDSRNRLYFSDPRYGSREDMQIRDEEGNTIEGVYRIDPDGKVSRVIGREVERANGVLVSPDDKYLFVADNNNDTVGGARKLYRFDLKPDGIIDPKSRKLLYDWGKGRGPDGVKQDSKGRLFVAGGLNKPNPPTESATDVKGGIYVIDPESGKLLAFLGVPTDEVTNCAFGGNDSKTLYITGGGTLYCIRTNTPGNVLWPPIRK
jgi:sugar lactone lactonase YvrE/dienelactone hydrolase